MRKLILTVLLATSAAMPAMAQDRAPDRHRDRGSQNERSEARAERRAERAQRSERAERPQVAERANWSERGAERQRAVEQQQAQTERRSWDRGREQGVTGVTRQMRRERSSAADAQRVQQLGEQQQRHYRGSGDRREQSIIGQVVERSRERQGQVAVRDGRNDSGYRTRHSGTSRQWSNHWRSDRNYDWRHYRDRNRSVFRLGRYYDPYRYGYRRFSIGFSLFPSYYGSNYWLNDPWMYRLPPAYGPYRWVRYYDDALLVNIYTGEVVDVEYDFFW